MLIEFTIRNFMSYRDEVSLSMVASTTVKECESNDSYSNVSITDNGKRYLRSAAIYGANGSGKSSVIAAMDIFKAAGFLPQIYDNLKSVNKKDVALYIGLIHSIMEGFGKARLDKDSKYKETTAFNSTPIVTGEVAPMESSTSARVLGLNWVMTHAELTHAYKTAEELRKIQDNLPIIGYHWIKFLHETDEILGKEYYAYRASMNEKLKNDVSSIREFNRCYTNILGLIDRDILDSPFSLSEVRVLYEIAGTENSTAKMLSDILQMDQGYLSRIINMFHSRGFINKHRSPDDRRIQHLVLSSLGKAQIQALNVKSDEQIAQILNSLPEKEKEELVDCMKRIKRILEVNYAAE